jgi:hypothetical protein
VSHEEIEILDKNFHIKASLKIPDNITSKAGIILAHGGIINRQSLIRLEYSLAEYLCDELNAFVIVPDLQGETIHKNDISFQSFSEIISITTKYFAETYDLEDVFGFGHSMGCFVLAQSLKKNDGLDTIVNYGGPIRELEITRQRGFVDYLIRYLSEYNYSLNIKNLMRYIFDKETCDYLEDVMLKEEAYCSKNYNYVFESSMFLDFKNIVDEYIEIIKRWGNPALLLFGTEDGVTKKTLNHYADNTIDDNLIFKHIIGASHITPCMNSRYQLSKFEPAVKFMKNKQFNENNTIPNYIKWSDIF